MEKEVFQQLKKENPSIKTEQDAEQFLAEKAKKEPKAENSEDSGDEGRKPVEPRNNSEDKPEFKPSRNATKVRKQLLEQLNNADVEEMYSPEEIKAMEDEVDAIEKAERKAANSLPTTDDILGKVIDVDDDRNKDQKIFKCINVATGRRFNFYLSNAYIQEVEDNGDELPIEGSFVNLLRYNNKKDVTMYVDKVDDQWGAFKHKEDSASYGKMAIADTELASTELENTIGAKARMNERRMIMEEVKAMRADGASDDDIKLFIELSKG